MGRCVKQFAAIVGGVFLCLNADRSWGFTVSGVEFTNYLLLDVTPNSNLQLSTSGDVYLQLTPTGVSMTAADFGAVQNIHFNNPSAPINVADTFSACANSPSCVRLAPTLFQDVVLRLPGTIGTFHIYSGGSIVLDTTPIPEPSTLAFATVGLIGLCCAGGRPVGNRSINPYERV